MRKILIVALLFISGCTGQVKPEITDNYGSIQELQMVKVNPSVVSFPKARIVSENGQSYMAFNAEESDQILAYRNASKNNKDSLEHMVNAHNNIAAERNLMVQALKLEEKRKNAMAESYAESENGRRYEQQTRIIETSIYKALLVIIGIAAL